MENFLDKDMLKSLVEQYHQKEDKKKEIKVKTEAKKQLKKSIKLDVKAKNKAQKIIRTIPKKCLKEAKRGNRYVIIDEYLSNKERITQWFLHLKREPSTTNIISNENPLYIHYLKLFLDEHNIIYWINHKYKYTNIEGSMFNDYEETVIYDYGQLIIESY